MDAKPDVKPPAADRAGTEIAWLFDAGMDSELAGPVPCGPAELFGLLTEALTDAGLVEVAVTGTVTSLRRRARWCGFELTELTESAEASAATVRCVVFAGPLAEIGDKLQEGAAVTAVGELRSDPAWGTVRIVVDDVIVEDERAGATLARDRLLRDLVASGQAVAQNRLAVPARPMTIGILAGENTAALADLDSLFDSSGIEWRLVRRPVPMSGPRAATAVAESLSELGEREVDVIVIARGGGARGNWSGRTRRSWRTASVPVRCRCGPRSAMPPTRRWRIWCPTAPG